MPRPARLLSALAAALCFAGPAPADPALPPALAPAYLTAELPSIVRVSQGVAAPGGCSGVLVTPRHVLTAAHCIRGQRTRSVIFNPSNRDALLIVPIANVARHPLRQGNDLSTDSIGYDLALLTLGATIAPEIAVPVALGDPDTLDPSPVMIAGYIGGVATELRAHFDCRLARVDGPSLGSDCHVVGGLSGSPVMVNTDDGWRLIAITSATLGQQNLPLRSLMAQVDPATFPALAAALDDPLADPPQIAPTVPATDQP